MYFLPYDLWDVFLKTNVTSPSGDVGLFLKGQEIFFLKTSQNTSGTSHTRPMSFLLQHLWFFLMMYGSSLQKWRRLVNFLTKGLCLSSRGMSTNLLIEGQKSNFVRRFSNSRPMCLPARRPSASPDKTFCSSSLRWTYCCFLKVFSEQIPWQKANVSSHGRATILISPMQGSCRRLIIKEECVFRFGMYSLSLET